MPRFDYIDYFLHLIGNVYAFSLKNVYLARTVCRCISFSNIILQKYSDVQSLKKIERLYPILRKKFN